MTQKRAFDRLRPDGAQKVLEKAISEATTRRAALEFFAATLQLAHEANPESWGVTLLRDRVRLNVGPGEALVLGRDGALISLDETALSPQSRTWLTRVQRRDGENLKSVPGARRFVLPAETLPQLPAGVLKAQNRFLARAATLQKRTPYFGSHSPGVLEFLRAELKRDLPNPAYADAPAPILEAEVAEILARAMEDAGLRFAPEVLAAYFTALQTKGFVLLSGLSGTGKTRLAQEFAALFPVVSDAPSAWALANQPGREVGRLILPAHAAPWLAPGGEAAVAAILGGAAHPAQLRRGTKGEISLQLRGAGRKWLQKQGAAALWCEPEWEDAEKPGFRVFGGETAAQTEEKNHLFLSVRPDWSDGKALLGYFNPLLRFYEWTPFLRFVLRALASFRAGESAPFFVVLDEMNLARVEHYFSDLLSVLESGRNQSGLTREPLRLEVPADATGERPPSELFLPPNLVFTGTLNLDETTHPFSPKVLDRAFVLELGVPDFSGYPPAVDAQKPLSQAERRAILRNFTQNGGFAQISRKSVALWIARHPETRDWLQNLNARLAPHEMGFGFRVFDEIAAFGAAGEKNGLWDDWRLLFDVAVSLKIVPRFRGARGRLEAGLEEFGAWCDEFCCALAGEKARQVLERVRREGFVG